MFKSNIRDQKSYVKKAYTIPEFCDAYSISRSKFYEMRKAGSGPRIMKVGRRTLISVEAATAWRRRLEANSKPDVRADGEEET
jgi:predicted DNA-binding transcriptional regulator AlpA